MEENFDLPRSTMSEQDSQLHCFHLHAWCIEEDLFNSTSNNETLKFYYNGRQLSKSNNCDLGAFLEL